MSCQFCIDKGVIGTSKHLFYDAGYKWVEQYPKNIPVFRYTPKPKDPLCLNTLFKLNGIVIEFQVPQRYIDTFKPILKEIYNYELIRWQHVLPKELYREFLSNLIQNIQKNFGKILAEYHEKVFSKVSRLFESLEFSSIDTKKLDAYKKLENSPSNRSNLESFRPVVGVFAKKSEYDRFGTRTGRLTIASGPEILTLKREYRDIVVSSYTSGKIFYVDFSALEARTFLTMADRDVYVKDVYEHISKSFLKGKYNRSTVKLVVLSLLFGSGTEALKNILNVDDDELKRFINKMKGYFCFNKLKDRLHKEWLENDKKIRNFYGRVINVPEESTLINSYIQSTSVDVALLGFSAIVENIKKQHMKVTPLFVLHDALILDVHPQHFGDLQAIIRPGFSIPKMKNQFFIHIDQLSVEQASNNMIMSK